MHRISRLRDLPDRLLEALTWGDVDEPRGPLRTAIARACTAAGIPAFSPHDLRHRRLSLLHLGGMPWARIGELVGHDDS